MMPDGASVRIAIVHNEPLPTSPASHWLSRSSSDCVPLADDFTDASESSILTSVTGIERALCELGQRPIVHAAANGSDLAAFLASERPDVVFNCCESLRGQPALELSVAAMFELFGVADTGSSALTLAIALDNSLTNTLFRGSGIPTPPFVVARTADDLDAAQVLARPLIVKPVAEDASNGIDDAAVVHDDDELAQRVEFVWSAFAQPALVEEFIAGRELNVALLAGACGTLEALPISEVSFDALPAGMPAIVSYDAKWRPDSAAYRATPVMCPAAIDSALAERVKAAALTAARAVGLRDYGRVDMRVRTGDEAIFVIEVNPNPDLSSDAGFMRAAAASGRPFAATVQQILSCATERARMRTVTSKAR
jgi:D-alanine-D-alanine ligase